MSTFKHYRKKKQTKSYEELLNEREKILDEIYDYKNENKYRKSTIAFPLNYSSSYLDDLYFMLNENRIYIIIQEIITRKKIYKNLLTKLPIDIVRHIISYEDPEDFVLKHTLKELKEEDGLELI